jgi:hypothetical protein
MLDNAPAYAYVIPAAPLLSMRGHVCLACFLLPAPEFCLRMILDRLTPSACGYMVLVFLWLLCESISLAWLLTVKPCVSDNKLSIDLFMTTQLCVILLIFFVS